MLPDAPRAARLIDVSHEIADGLVTYRGLPAPVITDYLTRAAAEQLVRAGARLVGIDSLNIDDTADLMRPAHTLLLRAGIPIVEHLCNLAALPAHGCKFFAVPVKVKGMGTFPVRAFALVE